MFGIIQECKPRPKVLSRGSKKNESSLFDKKALHTIDFDAVLNLITKDKVDSKYMIHEQKKILAKEINKRLNNKLQEYEEGVEKRRERLRDLLWREERELLRETVDGAQKAEEGELQEMKTRIHDMRSRREAERLDVVKEKKFQQYVDKCDEFRPLIARKRFAEAKEAQLLQMRENENRKASEKELDNMWYDILLKQIRAYAEREEEEFLMKKRQQAENRDTWAMQCKYNELQKQHAVREIKEDLIKMNNLKEQWLKEEIAMLDKKRRKREDFYNGIVKQIKERQEELAKQAEQDARFERAFRERQKVEEIEREHSEGTLAAVALKEELDKFRDYLARLDQERREEEKRINELVQKELKEIQIKQDEAHCKFQKARENLKQACKKKLKEQIEYRRQEAEEQLKIKEAENELIQLAYDQNERLRAEYERQKLLAVQQYQGDLQKQIDYRKLQKEREKEELGRLLAKGKAEEEEYKKTLLKLLNAEVKVSDDHPFRKIVDKEVNSSKFY